MERKLTKAQLLHELRFHPDDAEITFGAGDLTFYRVKSRSADGKLAQIEFQEVYEITHRPE